SLCEKRRAAAPSRLRPSKWQTRFLSRARQQAVPGFQQAPQVAGAEVCDKVNNVRRLIRLPLIGAVLCALQATSASAADTRWSFVNQITPILTFGGCNQSSCHGSPVGKNGFKLSLFGYQPEDDYAALVTKVPGRRVDPKEPLKSLVLLKPTMAV